MSAGNNVCICHFNAKTDELAVSWGQTCIMYLGCKYKYKYKYLGCKYNYLKSVLK